MSKKFQKIVPIPFLLAFNTHWVTNTNKAMWQNFNIYFMITVFFEFSLLSILYCRLLSYCRDSKVLYCCTVETVILETAVPCLLAAITQLPIPIHYCTISPFSENYEQNSDTGVWLKVKKFISFAFSANMDKWIICGLMGECKFFFWGPISRNTSKMMFLSDQTLT